jgi:O-antigen/teichoic acid export membrane protein
MKDTLAIFAKRSMYSAVSGLSTVFATFISGIIAANMLGVEGTGLVAFAIWLALIASQVVDGGTALCVGRFTADLHGQGDAAAAYSLSGRLARRLLFYNIIAVAAFAAFYFADPPMAADSIRRLFDVTDRGAATNLAFFVALLTFTQSFAAFGMAHYRGSQDFVTLAALSLVSMVAQIICVYLGALFFDVPGAIAGYVAGQLFLTVAGAKLMTRNGVVTTDLIGQTRKYGRYSWAANLCNTFVWSRIEILFLQSFWGYREVGLFSVALALSAIASQGPLLLTGAFLPMLAEKHGQKDRQGLQLAFASGTRFLAIAAFPACFGMAAIVPALVQLLYGPSFAPAIPAATIIATAAAFSITTVIGTHLVNALARSDVIFVTSLIGAALSIGGGFLLIPHYGLLGAAISRTATQLAMIGIGLWFITRRLRFSYPYGALLRILLAALVASLTAFVIVTFVPGFHGLIAAIVGAALVYALCLRFFGAVDPQDIALAHRLTTALPPRFAAAVNILLSFIDPGPAPGKIVTPRP